VHIQVERSRGLFVAVTALLSAVAALAVWAMTSHGPGLSPDSIDYIAAAESLRHDYVLRSAAGDPLTLFPPGLPMLLAALGLLGMSAETAFRFINALSVAVIVAVTALIASRALQSRAIALLATAVVCMGPVLYDVATMAWSDPLFMALTLSFIAVLQTVGSRGTAWRRAAVAGAIVGIAFSIRYAGLALIPTGVISICLLAWRRGSWRGSVRPSAAFLTAACVIPVLVILRNLRTDGTVFGERVKSIDSPRDAVHNVVGTLKTWVDIMTPGSFRLAVALLLVLLALGAVVTAFEFRRRDRQQQAVVVVVLFTAVFLTYMIISQVQTALDPLNTRLLSPIYVPLVIIFAAVADVLMRRTAQYRAVSIIAGATGVLLIASLSTTAADKLATARKEGVGVNQPHWRASALRPALQQSSTMPIYSNNVVVTWVLVQRTPIRIAPRRAHYRSPELTHDLERLKSDAREGAVLLWFGADDPADWEPGGSDVPLSTIPGIPLGPSGISDSVSLQRIMSADGASLYRVTER
jgi:4-amino-4-deoxy-L-arabinose transferase-like glycosyltransferase